MTPKNLVVKERLEKKTRTYLTPLPPSILAQGAP